MDKNSSSRKEYRDHILNLLKEIEDMQTLRFVYTFLVRRVRRQRSGNGMENAEGNAGSMTDTYKEQIMNLLDKVDSDDAKFFKQIFTMVNTHIENRSCQNNQAVKRKEGFE